MLWVVIILKLTSQVAHFNAPFLALGFMSPLTLVGYYSGLFILTKVACTDFHLSFLQLPNKSSGLGGLLLFLAGYKFENHIIIQLFFQVSPIYQSVAIIVLFV